MLIPERFSKRVNAHLLGNVLQIAEYPLILTIFGRPGMGKTWQLRNHLEQIEFKVFSISSADLESERAGEPAKLLRNQYVLASGSITRGVPAAIVIDDIDTTAGEWEQNTGTVNHQEILAFLMHIADNPTFIESVGKTNRVPVFFTGNNFYRLYEPMRRPGRVLKFEWEPTREEKISIITSIFSFSDKRISQALVDAYPTESISFFSSLLADESVNSLIDLANNTSIKNIFTDSNYKQQVHNKYLECRRKMDWVKYANNLVNQSKSKGGVSNAI